MHLAQMLPSIGDIEVLIGSGGLVNFCLHQCLNVCEWSLIWFLPEGEKNLKKKKHVIAILSE